MMNRTYVSDDYGCERINNYLTELDLRTWELCQTTHIFLRRKGSLTYSQHRRYHGSLEACCLSEKKSPKKSCQPWSKSRLARDIRVYTKKMEKTQVRLETVLGSGLGITFLQPPHNRSIILALEFPRHPCVTKNSIVLLPPSLP